MVRGSRFLAIFAVALLSWLLALNFTSCPELRKMLYGLPSYALISFGCYALFEIGKGLAFLKDYPEEHTSILVDIKKAKDFYKAKGATFLETD